MIKEEKIRMMTQVAMIQKREERRAIEICGYRKKDYVSIQMIKIWICYTMAYLLLTLIGVICMGNGTQAVSFSRQVLIRIGCIWVVGYLGFLTAVLATILVRQYRQYLMALEDYYTERSQINDSSAGTTAKDK